MLTGVHRGAVSFWRSSASVRRPSAPDRTRGDGFGSSIIHRGSSWLNGERHVFWSPAGRCHESITEKPQLVIEKEVMETNAK
ncbi:hypothetical protein EYF80_034699 [Liparis tanakae]|uniref:Uncharacterized protein n=1 Tax=Liparis tanakae TaxID=230148 RepID=A0A4Z2GPT1_9TELE|nr:hypothetical protein EYF80_034699 [Liparis tanakae]